MLSIVGWVAILSKAAASKQPAADYPELTRLEAELAAAQQPLPIDMKLQQLRRAVALSEEQLKNKRLTVAQDVVWVRGFPRLSQAGSPLCEYLCGR